MPASTSEIKAAEGASSSSNEMTSFSSCGIGIVSCLEESHFALCLQAADRLFRILRCRLPAHAVVCRSPLAMSHRWFRS